VNVGACRSCEPRSSGKAETSAAGDAARFVGLTQEREQAEADLHARGSHGLELVGPTTGAAKRAIGLRGQGLFHGWSIVDV
jgi:hypothetical protein